MSTSFIFSCVGKSGLKTLKKDPFRYLTYLRVKSNKTLGDISDETGYTPASVSAFESNKRLIPDNYVLKLSKALSFDYSKLEDHVCKLNTIFKYKKTRGSAIEFICGGFGGMSFNELTFNDQFILADMKNKMEDW